MAELKCAHLTERVLNAFFRVYDELGYGFLEAVYCAALSRELDRLGVPFAREAPLDVFYHGERIGHYRADFLIADAVVVEVKAAHALDDSAHRQIMNYLRASRVEVGLLLHFGPRARIKRVIYDNDRKPAWA